ncbi:MAG: hypothetical protein GX562_07620 [Coriobacteriaceae bacterium]|nr:hypothetical protein [Coriobacteriaceae bacterium]
MAGKYDRYVLQPPHTTMTTKGDGTVIFNGIFAKGLEQWGEPMNMGLQIISRPFRSDNPTHLHNFQEYLAWYGTNPDDPTDFDAEIVIYLGEELEEHIITQPTVLSLPPGLVHCPLEIKRVGSPIIQLEIMLPPCDGTTPTREPYFDEDKEFTTEGAVEIVRTPIVK